MALLLCLETETPLSAEAVLSRVSMASCAPRCDAVAWTSAWLASEKSAREEPLRSR